MTDSCRGDGETRCEIDNVSLLKNRDCLESSTWISLVQNSFENLKNHDGRHHQVSAALNRGRKKRSVSPIGEILKPG